MTWLWNGINHPDNDGHGLLVRDLMSYFWTAATMSEKVRVQVKAEEGVELPQYETDGAAGMDLRAHLPMTVTIQPGDRALVPTGLTLAIPPGYEGQIRPRSGLAVKQGVTLANPPGTIDCDYRGEVKIALINLGSEPFTIRDGDRIAQLVIAPVLRAELEQVEELPETGRGDGGFGHTGV
jgi:dUTP pyrophosphatase